MTHKVFILDSAAVPHTEDCKLEADLLAGCAETQLLYLDGEAAFSPFCESASALIVWHQCDLSEKTIRKLSKARVIVRNGVGYDNVDTATATECRIPVANVPDYGTEEVADHTLMLCLALSRQLRPLLEDTCAGNWRYQVGSGCRRLRGQVFGIVGCGRIGTAVALRSKAFGYQVVFYDPYLPAGYHKALGIGRVNSLDELLSMSDVVSLHVPLTSRTRGMIGEPQFRLMKPSTILLNTARGPVVSQRALEQALEQRSILGAGLDVLENEPSGVDLAARFSNCIMTPHSAFYSQESVLEMRRTSALIVREALVHGKLQNVVNQVRDSDVVPV